MSTATPIPPHTLLFAAESASARLVDGTDVPVRVVIVPVRRRLELFDYFERTRRPEILQAVVQLNYGEPGKTDWRPATPEWIDGLDSVSFETLYEIAHRLNFQNAIAEAERVIAMGNQLLPMQQRFAATAINPLKEELTSLMSSLTAKFTAALPATKP